jgi:hypothetical protein
MATVSCWFLVSNPGNFTFSGLHGDISQKMELSITTAVRISDPSVQRTSSMLVEQLK